MDDAGVGYFAINAPFAEGREDLLTLREAGLLATEIEVGAAVHGVALANWHDTHTHCARCGAETYSALGGSVRKCRTDDSEHYPRTDSAVIVLVRDSENRILLGRQKVWPAKRYSNFAGFLEPGESLEACVKREVLEEAGVRIDQIEYMGSQAWPFPASIMLAFTGVVESPDDARADGEEIEDRGVVAILDSRIVTKRYGSILLNSMPPFWRTSDGAVIRDSLKRLHQRFQESER